MWGGMASDRVSRDREKQGSYVSECGSGCDCGCGMKGAKLGSRPSLMSQATQLMVYQLVIENAMQGQKVGCD